MIHPMSEARRQHVHGSLHRDRKYISPRNALVILALALLAWVPIALVLL